MAISMRSVIAGLIKLILFFAFYMAGWLTNSQLNQYTIVSQQDRINMLENETALQQLQIPLSSGHRPHAGSAGPGWRRPGQHPGHSRPPELELAGTAGGPQPQCVRPPGPHHPHLPPIA